MDRLGVGAEVAASTVEGIGFYRAETGAVACGVRSFRTVALLVLVVCAPSVARTQKPPSVPPLPVPVTNNAVASGRVGADTWVFSALGVDSTKRFSGITRRAHAWDTRRRRWRALPDVPGTVGRLAATAQVVRERLVLFGGYTVDSAGAEHSLPNVDRFDPATMQWSTGAPMPVAVDDAVSGVWRDSLVFVVSGWHETDNVRDVQVYDVVNDSWSKATPIPGRGVFGHTGGVVGSTIVFIDGAAKQANGAKYALVAQVWVGHIDPARPTAIRWTARSPHPGPALYRAAATTCGTRLIVVGGTANPYNYNGIGYDMQPSDPLATVLEFDASLLTWRMRAPMAVATMDHRGLARVGREGWIVGGMRAAQQVSAGAVPMPLHDCKP